eukprot:gene21240-25523_t
MEVKSDELEQIESEEQLARQQCSTVVEAPGPSKAEVLAVSAALSSQRMPSTGAPDSNPPVTSSVESNLLRALNRVAQSFVLSDPVAPDNPIVHVSQAFLDMTGYSADEVLGRNCRFLQGPNTDPAARAQLAEAVREKKACSTRLLNYKKDGTPFWNCILICPVRNAHGE